MLRELRAVRKDGEEFDCELSVSKLTAMAGRPGTFTIVIRDISERKRAEDAEAEARAQAARAEHLERELSSLEGLTRSPQASVAARLYGRAALQESAARTHDGMVQSYGNLLDLALAQRIYRVDHHVSLKLRAMAEELAFLNAGPRDVVEIHSKAVKGKLSGQPSKKAQALLEEGRLVALELMGYLVSFYRDYCTGARGASSPGAAAAGTGEKRDGGET